MEILSKPKIRCKVVECLSCGATFRPGMKDLTKFLKPVGMGFARITVSGCLCPFCLRRNEVETEEIPHEPE